MFHVPEKHRINKGAMKTTAADGNNGAFAFHRNGFTVYCIASDGFGWQHVSVTINRKRMPTWEIMNFVKNMFWEDEDTVIQFHPKKSEYVNNHKYCLHLWKPTDSEINLPPSILTGIK